MTPNCKNCEKNLARSKGRNKIIKTLVDAELYTRRLKKPILLNDRLCDACRRLKLEDIPTTSQQAGFLDGNFQPLSSSSFESDSEENDAEFVYDKGDSIELYLKRVAETPVLCTICKSMQPGMKVVPLEARVQVYRNANIYIPVGNRCCSSHIINSIFFQNELRRLEVVSNFTTLKSAEMKSFFESICPGSGYYLFDKIKEQVVSNREIQHLTGFEWEHIKELERKLTSLNWKAQDNIQAIVVFLFQLRTAMSNEITATVFGIRNHRKVSAMFNAVHEAFKKDVITSFGIKHFSRDILLGQTSGTATKLLQLQSGQLALIFDGSYFRFQNRSTNDDYERKSYSGRGKTHLFKPFTICTTNGFIVDICGPYLGTQNDATIMSDVMRNADFRDLLKKSDIFVVYRGFQEDASKKLEEEGFRILMPSLKRKNAQFETTEANESRRVTKIRWVVEAVHGAIAQKYKLLHQNLGNKLAKVADIFKIVGYLQNEFGKRFNSDGELSAEILAHIESRMHIPNTLCDEVKQKGWNTTKRNLIPMDTLKVLDFPQLTEDDLTILFAGPYQLSLGVAYLAEMIEDNTIRAKYAQLSPTLLQLQVQSRHINNKHRTVHIEYTANNDLSGIKRYCCSCSNGKITVGCCAHVASIIYFLSHARHLSRTIRPAGMLSKLFTQYNANVVINDCSDDDG